MAQVSDELAALHADSERRVSLPAVSVPASVSGLAVLVSGAIDDIVTRTGLKVADEHIDTLGDYAAAALTKHR